jgi:sugar phosphate isomerase/epimerase
VNDKYFTIDHCPFTLLISNSKTKFMLNRRKFICNSATLAASAFLFPAEILNATPLLDKIGIQFFSVPKSLDTDLAATLSMLSKIGYKQVELYGPYPFSNEAGKKSWAAVAPSLGFSGSGFFGHSVTEFKKMLDDNDFTAPSMHTDLDTLEQNMPQLAEAAHILGTTYVVLPAIPADRRKTLDDYKKIAGSFNKIGADAKKLGIKYAYHNHGYGWAPMEGQIPAELIFSGTEPSLVFFEMDLYWTTAAGVDPVTLLKKYTGRYRLMHVKDMSKKMHFSGDGGDSKQWIELFPNMTTAGNGVLDLKTICTTAKANGMEYYIVEQDMVANPDKALKSSYDYLASL